MAEDKYWKHNDQVNTAAHGDVVPEKNEVFHNDIKWYTCHTLGQYDDQCPVQIGMRIYQKGIMFSQSKHGIKNTWLLLETCLSICVSNIPRIMKNVDKWKNKYILTIQTYVWLKYVSTLQVYTYFPFKLATTQNPYQSYYNSSTQKIFLEQGSPQIHQKIDPCL